MVCIIVVIVAFTVDALRDLIPFVQFIKRKKRRWRNVTFSITLRENTYVQSQIITL